LLNFLESVRERPGKFYKKRCAEKEDLFEAFAVLLNDWHRGSVGSNGVAIS